MFGLPSIFGFPGGDFVFDSGFNAAVAEASTSDAAFIIAELSKKLAHASRALMQKAKADADLRVASAIERLDLADKLQQAEAEILVLKDENQQLKVRCSKLESAASDNEKVLESLRRTVEGDANEKAELKSRISELEWVQAKLTELERVLPEVAKRAEGVYQEYKKALLPLARSLCPCLSQSKVLKFSSCFWIGCCPSLKASVR